MEHRFSPLDLVDWIDRVGAEYRISRLVRFGMQRGLLSLDWVDALIAIARVGNVDK